jgi:hypothetical protein
MRLALVCLLALAGVARADDRTAAVKAMIETQRKALLEGNDDAFKATFTSDGVLATGGRPSDLVRTWGGVDSVTQVKIVDSKIGWSGSWGWVAIEARVTSVLIAAAVEARAKPEPATFHWVALVVSSGDGVKTKAMALSRTHPDKGLSTYNYVQELVPRVKSPLLADALAHPPQLVKLLAADAATSVFGTSPNDRGLGAAAAKKLVAGWSKVALEVVETAKGQQYVDPKDYEPFELDLGDAKFSWARLRMKLPGQKDGVLVNATAIARKTANGFEIVAADYAAD